MRLSKLSIRNFRNFRLVEIPLSDNVVLLGENRVGKSNLLFAIRLILDRRRISAFKKQKGEYWRVRRDSNFRPSDSKPENRELFVILML